MKLDPYLLHNIDVSNRNTFPASLNAHGLYNTQQFVLRLSPQIHRILAEIGGGVVDARSVDHRAVQAASVYLHETIHWWQHVGSTYGLVLSLNYPIQTHCNVGHFRRLLELDGFKKSIRKQSVDLFVNDYDQDSAGAYANRIVNNHFDLMTYRAYTMGYEEFNEISLDPCFETVGHAHLITFANTVEALRATLEDKGAGHLCDPRRWEGLSQKLRLEGIEEYLPGAPIGMLPLGAREILEGQARFCQLQYINRFGNGRLTFSEAASLGMLEGVYIRAFDIFLKMLDERRPDRIDHPLVNLFLLVCDISLNPGRGLFYEMNPVSFIEDVNPGVRFSIACYLIKNRHSNLKESVHTCSMDEYVTVTEIITREMREPSSMTVISHFGSQFHGSGLFSSLYSEYERFSFRPENYVVRFLFAHFLSFQRDKMKYPHLFCWPGVHSIDTETEIGLELLFDRHGAPFVDREQDETIVARLQRDRDPQLMSSALNDFYHNGVVYDLVDQWIWRPEEFRFDVGWLTCEASQAEGEEFMRRSFKTIFGVDPLSAAIL